jgi:hypothetical protein
MSAKIKVKIKENSFRAKIAAFNLRIPKVAMVWGQSILLFNTTKEEFLADKEWVCHELQHVMQTKKVGKYKFFWRYVANSFKNGYYDNIYETDARLHATDFSLLEKVEFV